MAKKTKEQQEIQMLAIEHQLNLKEARDAEDVIRMKVLRHYIKRQLSRGLEIQGIDVQEIAEWPLNLVLKWFPERNKE